MSARAKLAVLLTVGAGFFGSRLAGGNEANAVRTLECIVPRWSGVPPHSLIATTSPSRV